MSMIGIDNPTQDGTGKSLLHHERITGAITGSVVGGVMGIVLPFTGIEYFDTNQAAKGTMTTAVGAAVGALIGTGAGHAGGLLANGQRTKKDIETDTEHAELTDGQRTGKNLTNDSASNEEFFKKENIERIIGRRFQDFYKEQRIEYGNDVSACEKLVHDTNNAFLDSKFKYVMSKFNEHWNAISSMIKTNEDKANVRQDLTEILYDRMLTYIINMADLFRPESFNTDDQATQSMQLYFIMKLFIENKMDVLYPTDLNGSNFKTSTSSDDADDTKPWDNDAKQDPAILCAQWPNYLKMREKDIYSAPDIRTVTQFRKILEEEWVKFRKWLIVPAVPFVSLPTRAN